MPCLSFDLCSMQNTKGMSKTHFKVRNIALLALVSQLSWKKKESLIWLLVSIIFGHDSSYKTILIWNQLANFWKFWVMFWRSDSYRQSRYQCTGQPMLVNYQCHPNPDEENNCGSGRGRTRIWMQRRFECCSRDVKSNAFVSINHWSIPAQSSIASSQGDIFFQSVSNPSLLPANMLKSSHSSSCLNMAEKVM